MKKQIMAISVFIIAVLAANYISCDTEDMWSRMSDENRTQIKTVFKVTYSGNGSTSGTVPVDNAIYSPGDEVIILGNSGNLAISGYLFNGWNTNTDGSGTDYTQSQILVMGGSDVVLYAIWVPVATTTYNVVYNANGATGGTVPVDTINYTIGQTAWVLDNTGGLYKTGLTFSGWNTLASGLGTNYAPLANIVITGNITLYAKWDLPLMVDDHFTAGINAAMFVTSGSPTTSGTILSIPAGSSIKSRLFKIPAVIEGVATLQDSTTSGIFENFCVLRVPDTYNKKNYPTGYYFSSGYDISFIRTDVTYWNDIPVIVNAPVLTSYSEGTVHTFKIVLNSNSQELYIDNMITPLRTMSYSLKTTLYWTFQMQGTSNSSSHELDRIIIHTIQQGNLP